MINSNQISQLILDIISLDAKKRKKTNVLIDTCIATIKQNHLPPMEAHHMFRSAMGLQGTDTVVWFDLTPEQRAELKRLGVVIMDISEAKNAQWD